MTLAAGLRYGENPHQPAAFYTDRCSAHRMQLESCVASPLTGSACAARPSSPLSAFTILCYAAEAAFVQRT